MGHMIGRRYGQSTPNGQWIPVSGRLYDRVKYAITETTFQSRAAEFARFWQATSEDVRFRVAKNLRAGGHA
jgi:hypothetical protein